MLIVQEESRNYFLCMVTGQQHTWQEGDMALF